MGSRVLLYLVLSTAFKKTFEATLCVRRKAYLKEFPEASSQRRLPLACLFTSNASRFSCSFQTTFKTTTLFFVCSAFLQAFYCCCIELCIKCQIIHRKVWMGKDKWSNIVLVRIQNFPVAFHSLQWSGCFLDCTLPPQNLHDSIFIQEVVYFLNYDCRNQTIREKIRE